MPYDFDRHEYTPKMDAEERAKKRKYLASVFNKPHPIPEWCVHTFLKGSQKMVVLESLTHDDDVWLTLSGNFSDEQQMAIALEVCAQLNKAELDAAKEFE